MKLLSFGEAEELSDQEDQINYRVKIYRQSNSL